MRAHFSDLGDQATACGSDEDYVSWRPDEVTCPDCKAEL